MPSLVIQVCYLQTVEITAVLFL